MKKIFLFIFTLGVLALGSCSDDSVDTSGFKYVTVSGDWELHLTSYTGGDSVIKHPNRTVQMTWSDMTYDSTLKMTVVNSQVTIGNGVWRFKSYINGASAGTYALQDTSSATYSYTTAPAETDSLNIINYKLTGSITWDASKDSCHSDIRVNFKAINDANQTVSFIGTAESALAK